MTRVAVYQFVRFTIGILVRFRRPSRVAVYPCDFPFHRCTVRLVARLSGTRVSIGDTLKEGARGGTTGVAKATFRRALVIAEIGLSLVLVFAAGLLTQSVLRLQHQNLGFRPDHVLKAKFYLPPVRYPDARSITQFCDRFGERLRIAPRSCGREHDHWPFPRPFRGPRYSPSRAACRRVWLTYRRHDGPLWIAAICRRWACRSLRPRFRGVRHVHKLASGPGQPRVRAAAISLNENPLGQRIHMGPPRGLPALPLSVQCRRRGDRDRRLRRFPKRQHGRTARSANTGDCSASSRTVNYGFKDIVVQTKADPQACRPPFQTLSKNWTQRSPCRRCKP